MIDTFTTGVTTTGSPIYAPFPIVPPYKLTAQPTFPNSGLIRNIQIMSTAFSTENGGSTNLIYGHEYKFAVLAYGYNTRPKRGQVSIRNSLGSSILTIRGEAPMAGTNFYYKNTDTINTSHRDLGVIPVVLAQEKLIDAKYRVIFTGGTMPNVSYDLFRSFNNFVTYDTLKKNLSTTMTGLALDDSSRIFDGILFKVPGIRSGTLNPASNNIGVIKDPGTNTADTLQTRYQGWDYKGNRNLTGSAYKQNSTRPFQSVSMSLSYPMQGTYTNIGSLYKDDSLKNVKIVFTGYGNGSQAYHYLATTAANYSYQDMKEVPFKVYEIDPTDGTPDPRQLNCAFLEFPDASPAPDGKWEPTADSLGGKEVVYIFGSNYDANPNTFYTNRNLLLTSQLDVMYVWSAKLITPGPVFNINDELTIFPYTKTRAGVIYDIDTKKPQIGNSSVAVENNDLNNIKAVPNPYYGYNTLESQSSGRYITFRRLPALCTFKIYTINGDLIKVLEKTDDKSSTMNWNMTNLENVPVASGIYIVLIDAPGIGQKVLKVAIFTPQERIDF
jgi:hypothetical protein